LEHSGEAKLLRARHAAFFTRLAEDAESHLRRADARGEWLDRVEEEHDNLRAALQWLESSGDAEAGLRLAYDLSFLWWLRGYVGEGRAWMGRFLALPAEHTSAEARASVLVAAGVFARHQNDHAAARRLLEAALVAPCAREPTAHQAQAAYWLGGVSLDEGNYSRAREYVTASLKLARDIGDTSTIVRALNGLGEVARASGEPEKAQALYTEALTLLRERDDSGLLVMTLCNLAGASVVLGDHTGAAALLRDVLTLELRFRSKRNVAVCLSALTGLAVACAAPQDGAQLAGATDALLEQTAGFLDVTDRAQYERSVAAICGQLPSDAYRAAYERGAAMKLDEALAFALEVLADWSEGAAGQQLGQDRLASRS
jgi:non-specific serine/threonine protein kinase